MPEQLTIDQLHRIYEAGETTPSEICRAALDRIEEANERLNAFTLIDRAGALAAAAKADAGIRETLAFLSACRVSTIQPVNPFARAVRM